MHLLNKKSLLAAAILTGSFCQAQNKEVYNAGRYIVYRDSIVQGKYVAKALSDKELVSNYKSPANEFKSPAITFKFSINGKDNEMKSGIDHHFVIVPQNGLAETPLVRFGTQLNDKATIASYLKPNTLLKIRLDMREVMNAFKSQGYYTAFNGDKIYQNDFKGVYVAGSAAPLTWDFDNLVNHPKLQLHDEDGDGVFEVVLNMNDAGEEKNTATRWGASKNVAAYPAYSSEYPISDVLYNLALEEMVNAIEPDSTFRTGKEWAGVWTRDISYSIILSMAHLQPRVAMYSLLRKVNKKKKIIQDTGTGGAWPASTDRMIWAVAAWELYKVTGDKDWLQEAYLIIKNSIDVDLNTAYDKQTGLVKGESSFLDWREQTYPGWMQSVDIAESECLGTNAVHYQANLVLGKMASLLHHPAEASNYTDIAQKIKKGINTYLWQPAQKYYGQYLYGRNSQILSPRAEALGEALTVIFDIADSDKQKQIVAHTPVTDFGIPCIFPQIPNIPPYHNNAIWPFVQTFWLWAGAKAANDKAVMESIAAIYRPAALFVTNKENFVADNGDFLGTQINSSNMLWSLSGNISVVHKVLFGIRFNESNLSFEPFVPLALKGTRTLKNFKYRHALLNIEMEGYGNHIKKFLLDGKVLTKAVIMADLKGEHNIKIILADNVIASQTINKVANYTTLPAPDAVYENGKLKWSAISGAKSFKIIKKGKLLSTTKANDISIQDGAYAEYQVIAVDNKGIESFASEPIAVVRKKYKQVYEAEEYVEKADYPYQGFSGKGFSEISLSRNKIVTIPVTVSKDGLYAVDFRYANGNGPTNTENKCAIRTLEMDGKRIGTSLFPQRGKEEWSNWGYSNSIKVHLSKGRHIISLIYEESNENMNEVVNQAMIDQVRLIQIGIL
jgi:hypothetical protein